MNAVLGLVVTALPKSRLSYWYKLRQPQFLNDQENGKMCKWSKHEKKPKPIKGAGGDLFVEAIIRDDLKIAYVP